MPILIIIHKFSVYIWWVFNFIKLWSTFLKQMSWAVAHFLFYWSLKICQLVICEWSVILHIVRFDRFVRDKKKLIISFSPKPFPLFCILLCDDATGRSHVPPRVPSEMFNRIMVINIVIKIDRCVYHFQILPKTIKIIIPRMEFLMTIR